MEVFINASYPDFQLLNITNIFTPSSAKLQKLKQLVFSISFVLIFFEIDSTRRITFVALKETCYILCFLSGQH